MAACELFHSIILNTIILYYDKIVKKISVKGYYT